MKTLFVWILSVFICSVSFAQKKNLEDPIYGESNKNAAALKTDSMSSNNFQLENGKLIWQKVFETQLDYESFVNEIKTAGILYNTEIIESRIIGELKQIPVDFKGAGYKNMNAPIILTRSDLTAHCVIDFKEKKYRVTLKNIYLIQRFDDVFFKMGEKTSLDQMAIKSETLAKGFIKTTSVIVNYSFTNVFSSITKDPKDNW